MRKPTRIFTKILLVTAALVVGVTMVAAQDDVDEKAYRLPGQKTCAPTANPSKIEASASGGSYSFRINLPRNCESSVTYWTDRFISTPSPQDSKGSVTISFRVAANDARRKRTGFVKVTGHVNNNMLIINRSVQSGLLWFSRDNRKQKPLYDGDLLTNYSSGAKQYKLPVFQLALRCFRLIFVFSIT